MSALDRILSRTVLDEETGCLRWQGAKNNNGYGRVALNGRVELVHRAVYILSHGPIPDGMVIDHVYDWGCRHIDCANPEHLEAVTPRENVLRSSHERIRAHVTNRCARGHELSGENEGRDGNRGRYCKACRRDARKALYARTGR